MPKKQRSRGSGSLRKRGRSLQLRYRANGRRITEGFPRLDGESMESYRKRADEELDRILTELKAGIRSVPTHRTVEELAEAYLDALKSTVKARTYETRERNLALYVLPELGSVRVDQLSTEDIRSFQRHLLSRKVRGGRTMALVTAKNVMGVLRDLVKYAMDGQEARAFWGVSFDPWPQRSLKWPDPREKPAPHTYAPYSSEELQKYLSATPDEYKPHMLALALLMLRDGELRGLRWADLDEERKVCRIEQQQSRKHGMTTTKTAASEAEIPVPSVLLDALREHKKRQAEVRLRVRKWQDNDLIFCTAKGTPLLHNWFVRKINGKSLNERISEAAGLRRVSEHTLRKTGATLLEVELRVPRAVVQAALRHQRQNVTDVYVNYDAQAVGPYIEELATLVTKDLATTWPQTDAILADSG